MDALLALKAAATAVQVPLELLLAICSIESNLNHLAYNHYDGNSPSYGLCQVKHSTAKWLGYKGDKEGLFSPKTNATYAAKYLKYQLNRYRGNWFKATSAYNRGTASMGNQKYVWKVFNTMWRDKHVRYRYSN